MLDKLESLYIGPKYLPFGGGVFNITEGDLDHLLLTQSSIPTRSCSRHRNNPRLREPLRGLCGGSRPPSIDGRYFGCLMKT